MDKQEYIDEFMAGESISDEDLRAFLANKGLDPTTAPYPCVLAVAEEYLLPVAEAQRMVDWLR